MDIIDEPGKLSAQDLLKMVKITHCGPLMIYKKGHWRMCYGIISQGCIYLYDNFLSKEAFLKKSLRDFENVWVQQGESKERNCFYLGYTDGTPSLHICCDTEESTKKWVDTLKDEIVRVKTWFNPSGDSGFGSAGSIAAHKSAIYEDAAKNYVEVDQRRFGYHHEDQHDLHSEEVDDDYENVNFRHPDKETHHTIERTGSIASSFLSVSPGTDSYSGCRTQQLSPAKQSNPKTSTHTETKGKQFDPQEHHKTVMAELKNKLGNKGLACGGHE